MSGRREDRESTTEQGAADAERARAGYSPRENRYGKEDWEIPDARDLL